MTFCPTQDMLDAINNSLVRAQSWCNTIRQQPLEEAALTVVDIAEEEIAARRQKIEHALQNTEEELRQTYLQNASTNSVEKAANELCSSLATSEEEIKEVVETYLEELHDAIEVCKNSANATRPEPLFEELSNEFRISSSTFAWQTRQTDEGSEMEQSGGSRGSDHHNPSGPSQLIEPAKKLVKPEKGTPVPQRHRWVPFEIVFLSYLGVLLIGLVIAAFAMALT